MSSNEYDVVVYLMSDVSLLFESMSGESTINDLRIKMFKIFALNTKNVRICNASGSSIDSTTQLQNLQANGKIVVYLLMDGT